MVHAELDLLEPDGRDLHAVEACSAAADLPCDKLAVLRAIEPLPVRGLDVPLITEVAG